MKKHYTYEDLPKKGGGLNNIQYQCTDEIILEYLNKIAKNSNRMISIDYEEISKSDAIGEIHITFKMVKEYPDVS